jgi:hypothetical protein
LIKQCEVLSYNPYSNVLAFKYDGLNIQITIDKQLDKKVRNVYIKFENNTYTLSDEKEIEKQEKVKVKSQVSETIVVKNDTKINE